MSCGRESKGQHSAPRKWGGKELTAEDSVDPHEPSWVARVRVVGHGRIDAVYVVEPWRGVREDEMGR